ncbi:MAG: membrane protein insertase YidC [Candidatus Rokuibacteriota bacterium]
MSQEKRTVLAMGLMVAVIMVYQYFFFTPPPASERVPKPAAEAPAPKPETVAAPPAPTPATAPAPARASERPMPPPRLATVDTPLYRAVVSSEGGKLQELVLRYRGEKRMVIVGDLGPAGLLVGSGTGAPPVVVPMTLSAESVSVKAGRAETLALAGETDGLRIRQTLHFDPETYAIAISVRVENASGVARKIAVELPWASRLSWAGAQEQFPGQHPVEVVWSIARGVDRAPHWMNPTLEGLIEAPPALDREGDWVAMGSIWYLAALMPKTGGFRLMVSVEKPAETKDAPRAPSGRATIAVRATPEELAPGKAWEGDVVIFVGPKEYYRLGSLGLEDTINFGGFPIPWYYGGLPMRWFGVPILLLMNWVYRYVGNYGIAIILLTVVTRVLFYPLTLKSMRSMKAMQALQPQINALRSKYKNDAQRLQRETMELYRANKVNPLGGCLPMVAQVPIFYALYLALSVSVELQNSPFVCFGRWPKWVPAIGGESVWICDLASQDPTYVLPILMGITMFVQQKMTPMGGDPRQAKIMLVVMPIMFTAMFLNLPSGLVLYWTVSNVLQIAQQKYTNQPQSAPKEARA